MCIPVWVTSVAKHPLAFDESPEERQARRQGAYDDKLAAYLLGRYQLTSHKGDMLRETHAVSGAYRLTLNQFVDRFNFPVFLASDVIEWHSKNLTIATLFNNFTTRKIVKLYDELAEEAVPDEYADAPFGLVFAWTKVSRGLILHNAVSDISMPPLDLKKPCVRVIWTPTERTRRVAGTSYLTVEPLEQFLAALDWEPSSD
jgi:hypothetical protein